MNNFFEVQQDQPDVHISKKKIGILDEIKKLLTTNTNTIITISISIAIGTAFNTLVTSFISDVIRPLCIKLLLLTQLQHVLYNVDQVVDLQKQDINISIFISSFVSFLILSLLCYQINTNLMKYL